MKTGSLPLPTLPLQKQKRVHPSIHLSKSNELIQTKCSYRDWISRVFHAVIATAVWRISPVQALHVLAESLYRNRGQHQQISRAVHVEFDSRPSQVNVIEYVYDACPVGETIQKEANSFTVWCGDDRQAQSIEHMPLKRQVLWENTGLMVLLVFMGLGALLMRKTGSKD